MPARSADVRKKVARAGGLSRRGGPEFTEARRDLAAAVLEEHIRQVVDNFPPLSAEQRSKLVVLLCAPGTGTAGDLRATG